MTTTPDNLFDLLKEQQPQQSVFDQLAYEQMTQDEKLQASKAKVLNEMGVTQAPESTLTIADQVANAASSKITRHADGSLTVNKGVLGNEKPSAELIKILREQAYARHNITE